MLIAAAALEPGVLALCQSPDPVARGFCLESLLRSGDPQLQAKETVARMAAHDADLHDRAAEVFLRLYGEHAPAYAPAEQRAPPSPSHGDPMRVVYAPTAFIRPEGTGSFNAYELGTFTFDWGLNEHVSAGLQTALPVGAFVVGPEMRFGASFEGGAIAVQLQAIAFLPFVGNSKSFVVAGGGPVLTLGNLDNFFNLGVLTYFATASSTVVFAPHAGFSLRAAEGVRFGAEVYVPSSTGNDGLAFGKAGAILWGFRFFGSRFWGDVALLEPICDGCGGIYSVLPIGIPFVNFGLGWGP